MAIIKVRDENGDVIDIPAFVGPKGDPGADYVLTEADKAEIAELAAELVEVPEGGNGEDGFSPIATVEQTADGAAITITDKNGTTTATVTNGKDGSDGVSTTHSWNGTILTVTSASGTSSANLKGEKGDKGDSIKGDKGDTGTAGKTAYAYAQDGGYAGTEAEFAEKLANEYSLNPLYGKKVSFLGDSICAGSSESTSYLGGYGKIIADRNGMVYENVAHGGATVTAETYSRSTGNAKPWLCRMVANMSADADYAIIEGGINDGWDETVKEKIGTISVGYNATLDDTTYYGAFESMLKQLVTKFQGKKIGYIAVPKIHSLYDSSQNAPNFYHIALECCAKWGVSVCDLNTITPPVEYLYDLGTEYTADGTHPTHEGYLKYYCDPIEAWMKTLTTGASVSVGAVPSDLDRKYMRKSDVQIKKAQLTLEDGSTVLIDVVVASAGTTIQTYTNQVIHSVGADKVTIFGSDYNGDGKNDGYLKNYRLSASSGSEKSGISDASIIGFIEVKPGDVVRFQYTGTNTVWDQYSLNSGYNVIAYYSGDGTWLGSICPLQSNSVYGICSAADTSSGSVANGGIVSFTVPADSRIKYLRLSIAMDTIGDMGLADLIVTVNEEIT